MHLQNGMQCLALNVPPEEKMFCRQHSGILSVPGDPLLTTTSHPSIYSLQNSCPKELNIVTIKTSSIYYSLTALKNFKKSFRNMSFSILK